MTFDDLARGKNGKGETRSPDWLPSDTNEITGGYGTEVFELNASDLDRLNRGEIMAIYPQGEYGVYIRLKPNSCPSKNSPMGEK